MSPDGYNAFETAKSILRWLPVAAIAAAASFAGAHFYKPAPLVVQPQTTVVARGVPGAPLTRAEQRQAAAQWGDLDQKEVNALAANLKNLPKVPLTIFCADDALCGDMQLDFDNAFETAHWETKLEKPLIDATIGVATSREDLREAINAATSGRLAVGLIKKTAPYEVLAIGKKAKR